MSLRSLILVVVVAVAPCALLAEPKDHVPADAKALRECVASKDTPKAQHAVCFKLIVKRCLAAVGNEYDSTVRDCYRREEAAWDIILNDEYRALGGKLVDAQKAMLRDAAVRLDPRQGQELQRHIRGISGRHGAPADGAVLWPGNRAAHDLSDPFPALTFAFPESARALAYVSNRGAWP
jgi:hypothetical protein